MGTVLLVPGEQHHYRAESDQLHRCVARRPRRNEREEVVRDREPAERPAEGDEEVRGNEHHERHEQEIEREVEAGDDRDPPCRPEARNVIPALVVTLSPASPLPKPGPDRSDALLRDERVPAEPDLPVEPPEMEAEIEVFRQAVGPRVAA